MDFMITTTFVFETNNATMLAILMHTLQDLFHITDLVLKMFSALSQIKSNYQKLNV